MRSPYFRYHNTHMSLRDALAVDRTIVANERTLLGYIRTTLALLAAGGSLLHFFGDLWAWIAGFALIGLSVPLLVIGIRHYIVRRSTLAPLVHTQSGTAVPND